MLPTTVNHRIVTSYNYSRCAGGRRAYDARMPPVQSSPDGSPWLDGVAYRIWLTSQAVAERFVAEVEASGVTVTQMGLLVHLDELGSMSSSDLSRLLSLTPQGIAKALRQLEERGWVERSPHPHHGRVVLFEVTSAGATVAAEGRARAAVVNAEIEAGLPGDATSLREGLDSVRATLRARPRGPEGGQSVSGPPQ